MNCFLLVCLLNVYKYKNKYIYLKSKYTSSVFYQDCILFAMGEKNPLKASFKVVANRENVYNDFPGKLLALC